MTTARSFQRILFSMGAFSLLFAGCYTKLMTPDELLKKERRQVVKNSGDYSYSLNYRQQCRSCHSTLELTERSEELEYYGIRTVHEGILLSSRLWNDEVTVPQPVFFYDPNPYWSNPYSAVTPWWTPAVIVGSSPVSSEAEQRRRSGGATSVTGTNSETQNTAVPSYNPPPSNTQSATTTQSSPSSMPVTTPKPQADPPSDTEEGRRKKIPD